MKPLPVKSLRLCLVLILLCVTNNFTLGDVAYYVTQVQDDSPVAYWQFEEANTSQAAGNSQENSDYDGNYEGGALLVSGKAAQAVSLNNTDAYIRLGNNVGPALHGTSSVTIEAWINNADIPENGDEDNVIFNTNIDEGRAGAIIQMCGSNIQVAGRSISTENYQEKTAGYTSTGQWHHIVGILDFYRDKIRIYIDGELQNAGDENVSFSQNSYNCGTADYPGSIGARALPDRHFNGLIDEVAIYRKALDDMDDDGTIDETNRVLVHYNALPEPTTISLLATGTLAVLLKKKHSRNEPCPDSNCPGRILDYFKIQP